MMTLQQALAYGRQVGVRYYVVTQNGAVYGGATTREYAEEMKRRFERENRNNPFLDEPLRFEIKPA